MIHTFVCVASNVSVSPDGYKPITILGSCMYGKRVLVHIQTCHSVHTCVCHVTRWPSVDSRSSTDCNRHITIFGSCMWGKRVTVHNTNVLRRTRVWVTSRIWMSHVTHMDESCHAYGWVTSRIWMSHVTHMDESCHAYGWVMSRIWMSHVTHMDESRHANRCIMSRIWMSYVTHLTALVMCHVTHTEESWCTHVWVMWCIWISHVTHLTTPKDESCYTHRWVMSRIWGSHVTHMDESSHTPWSVKMPRDGAQRNRRGENTTKCLPCTCVTWLVNIIGMSRSYA